LDSSQHTPGGTGIIIKLTQVFKVIKVPNQHDAGVQLVLNLKVIYATNNTPGAG
jgi:hypothetical protein